MPFSAVLDANVLYPNVLRDTLLTIAESEVFIPIWSEQIQMEAARNLAADKRIPEASTAAFVRAMNNAFPEALVERTAVAQLEPAMTNHPEDRHVLAAAVSAGADRIVTENTRHFDISACAPHGVEAVRPDHFLVGLLTNYPGPTIDAIYRQAGALKRPPMTARDILGALAAVKCPMFAERAGAIIT